MTELQRGRRCRLVVFGLEVGGRWGTEAVTFLRLVARARSASVHAAVRSSAAAAHVARWSGLIAVAAQRASLLKLPLGSVASAAGAPALHEVLEEGRWKRVVGLKPPPRADSRRVAERSLHWDRAPTDGKSVREKRDAFGTNEFGGHGICDGFGTSEFGDHGICDGFGTSEFGDHGICDGFGNSDFFSNAPFSLAVELSLPRVAQGAVSAPGGGG